MVWPFTFDWCVLSASELVRSVIRTPCCRVLVHKTCLYSSLVVKASNPTPTCPHCQQDLGLARFRRFFGACRVSGVHGLNVPLPLLPPYAHSYHGVYLQIMDLPLPPSSTDPDDEEWVSGTHRLNRPSRLTPLSYSFLCRST